MYNKLLILVIILLIYIFTNVEHFASYFNLSSHCENVSTKDTCCNTYGSHCKWNDSYAKCLKCSDHTNLVNNCSSSCFS